MAVWAVLMLLALPALMLLGDAEKMRDPVGALNNVGVIRRYHEERARRRAQAVEAARFAAELRTAAVQAREAAVRWQAHWRAAEEHADGAWQAWRKAEQRFARTRAGAVYPVPDQARTPQEYADRETFLHRALRAAAKRGDLPATALAAAIAGRDGWDPRLHPVDQEIVVLRAVAGHRRRSHRRAVAAEQAAWQDARLAASTRDRLCREAVTAAARAAAVHRHLPDREFRIVLVGSRSWSRRLA
ncbi:hypothetical protein [Actinoplanes regularis]|uniref:hypothetical protein n=1 Tax=Actinoplanes regularis TaxID=52697 RepID=UPI0024A197C5|nr:hypothetical protein [Actinoplanes regularis]GLW35884.1 hypothetical protein Areg01_88190 [Actinoplanes regularis]